jgi:acetate---CoA ligase (ADP-forming)
VGSGGVLVELIGDARTLLFPVTAAEVERAVKSLRVATLMEGFRGKPKGDIAAAVAAVLAVARYAEVNQDVLAELDINPLIVRPEGKGVVAVDALVRRSELRVANGE